MAFCSKCGNELREGLTFCTKCGAAVSTAGRSASSETSESYRARVWQSGDYVYN